MTRRWIERALSQATATPREWPLWAKTLEMMRKPGEAGVGDTVHRLTGELGEAYIAKRKAWGIPCRCPQRRAAWNVAFPYT